MSVKWTLKSKHIAREACPGTERLEQGTMFFRKEKKVVTYENDKQSLQNVGLLLHPIPRDDVLHASFLEPEGSQTQV